MKQIVIKLILLREIGRSIAHLVEKSKKLREQIAKEVNEIKVEKINEDKFICFLMGNTKISIKKAGKDFTILFEDLKQLEDTE